MGLGRRFAAGTCIGGLALAACGSTTVSAATWAASICNAELAFVTTTSSISSQLPTALQSATSLAQARASVSGFLGTLATSAQRVETSAADAGVPDVKNGGTIESEFLSGMRQSVARIQSDKRKVEGLSVVDATAFESGLEAVGTDLQTLGGSSAAFSKLGQQIQGTALDRAAKAQPACQKLTSSG